jgi:N4-gp56 family major capsid protein
MASTYTTTTIVGGNGGSVIPPFYADFLRANLYPNLYFRQLGTKVTIPQGYGDKVKIPRWQTPVYNHSSGASAGMATLTTSLTAVSQITESSAGASVVAKTLGAEDITGQVAKFAGARGYTDKLIITAKANFLEGALESLTRELACRIDNYTRTQLDTAAIAFSANAGTGTTATTTDGLFGKNVAKIAPFMDSLNVPRWEDQTFVGVFNPLVQYDVYRDPSAGGFTNVARYNDASKIYRGEIGQKFGLRFLLSNTVPVTRGAGGAFTAAGLSAASTGSIGYVFAPDAFYSLELEKGGVEVIHHQLGSGGATGDPANEVGAVSVKVFYGVCPSASADNRLLKFAHGVGLHF